MDEIGQLEEVDIREVWPSEATDFTPWLADEGGLAILGKRLGLELVSATREVDAGPFKVDIVCFEASDPNRVIKVVIENQLKTFDHSHLGQAQAYSLEVEAGICIWVAKDFRPEHLAVVEELNSTPGREVNYYCVTVKAVRIGDSPPAPLFDLVLGPDHKVPSNLRTVPHELREVQADPMPKGQTVAQPNSTQEFLDALRRRLVGRYDREAIPGKSRPYLRFNLGPGPARFSIEPWGKGRPTRVRLYMRDEPKRHLEWNRQLETDKVAINAELGESADWNSTDERSVVDVSLPVSIQETSDRDEEIEWCIRMLLRYEDVFVDRLKILRAGKSIVPRVIADRAVTDAA